MDVNLTWSARSYSGSHPGSIEGSMEGQMIMSFISSQLLPTTESQGLKTNGEEELQGCFDIPERHNQSKLCSF